MVQNMATIYSCPFLHPYQAAILNGIYKLYKDYFLHLNKCHPKVLHDSSGNTIFELVTIEEAFGDFRGQIAEKSYMFRLIEYTWGLDDNYTSNGKQTKQGGFIIAKYHSDRAQGSEEYAEAIADTEEIALDFAEKMCADSKESHPLFYYSIDTLKHMNWNAQVVRHIGDGTYSGWLCTFQFDSWFRNCIGEHTDTKWKKPSPHTY